MRLVAFGGLNELSDFHVPLTAPQLDGVMRATHSGQLAHVRQVKPLQAHRPGEHREHGLQRPAAGRRGGEPPAQRSAGGPQQTHALTRVVLDLPDAVEHKSGDGLNLALRSL